MPYATRSTSGAAVFTRASPSTSRRPGTRASASPRMRGPTMMPVPSATMRSASRAICASAASCRASMTNSGFAVITNVRRPASSRSKMRADAERRSRRSKGIPRTSTASRTAVTLVDGDEAPPEEVEVLEGQAGPLRDAVERILGHIAGDAGDLGHELVHVAQQGAAARQDHALVDHIRRQLWRSLLQHALHCGDDLLENRVHRLGDLVAADGDGARQAGDEVATADLHRELGVHRHGRADLDLHVLGGALADHQVVPLAHEVRDRLVELVACGAHAARDNDAAERDHRDLRGAATDADEIG